MYLPESLRNQSARFTMEGCALDTLYLRIKKLTKSFLPEGHSFVAQTLNGITAVRAFNDNYIWLIASEKSAIVVDPGQAEPVLEILSRLKLELTAILLTHHHQDHVGGVKKLLETTGAKVWGPATEDLPHCDNPLVEGDRFEDRKIGIELSVLDVPGHTAGHIAFAGTFNGEPVLFCGDTLFATGCGRLFEGTAQQMVSSLAKLAALPTSTKVYCAHEYTLSNMRWALTVDPENQDLQSWHQIAVNQRNLNEPTIPSTIGQELACNPFMRTQQKAVVNATTQWANRNLDTPVEVFAALREWKNHFR